MAWDVEFTDEFGDWWSLLTDEEQDDVAHAIRVLQENGPMLGRPHVDSIKSSKHHNMKELRIQHKGDPYRVLFVFDPRRTAVLLIGGSKVGNEFWYEENVPKADKIYDNYLAELGKEGLI
jgi:hypothetical protein